MKSTKTMLLILIIGTVTFTGGLFAYSTMSTLSTFEYSLAGFVLLTVVFSIIVGIGRLKNERKGLPADDELSNAIKQKAASRAFAYSFYTWTGIAVFTVDSNLRNEIPIGIGIALMGLLFIGFWIYYAKTGIANENSH